MLAEFSSGPQGLDPDLAAARLEREGPNLLRPEPERALLLQLLARFSNPLILLLLGASVLSALTGDVTSFLIITVMILFSVTLDFFQEHRAAQAAERLRQSVAVRASVVRGGKTFAVPASTLVPGDVVRVAAGALVPADGVLLVARDFFVNQSLLTGEPYPVERRPDPTPVTDTEPGAAIQAVFMGTSVVSGTADLLICRTGMGTVLGTIHAGLSEREPPSPFELGVRSFGAMILRLALLMVLFVLLVNTAFHRPWLESFLFAVALAVGLAPELLPMVVSVTLARGALRMADRKVIVKRLAAIHDLGSMDILCTDKTGTLTEARIRLERHLDPLGREAARVLDLAYLNSALETGLRNPLDEAILRHEEVDISGWRKLDEVPFDFERRRVSVLAETPHGNHRLLVVKGAFEDILALSTRFEQDGPDRLATLDATTRAEMSRRFDELGSEGFRVLGIAWREVPREQGHAVVVDEANLVFAGFAAFEDPPKPSAAAAIQSLAERGVRIKVVTGDNELVTQHVAAELNLPLSGVLTGQQVQDMGDDALLGRVESVDLFCRVTPAQKNRVILALKRRGHVVGYLGDGINDAPSLRSADVGISVEGAVDVAKAAADMILLEQDLGVVHAGVMEGRRTFGNILKYIMMGTSSNFGNMFSMAAASLLLPFLPMLPVQILVNNFLYDLSEVPIPMDRVDAEFIQRPRSWNMRFIRSYMLTVGPVSSVFDFATFFVLLRVFRADEALFHTGWFVESLVSQVLVIFVIRTRGVPWRSQPSRLLTLVSLTVVAVAIALPFTPLGTRLGLVPPPLAFFGILVGMVTAYLVSVELVKRWFYRHVVAP